VGLPVVQNSSFGFYNNFMEFRTFQKYILLQPTPNEEKARAKEQVRFSS
jgi:hypothetical protein